MSISNDELRVKLQTAAKSDLDLTRVGLTLQHMQLLAEYVILPDFAVIKNLYLGYNPEIGDEGGEVICSALCSSPYCKLESIDLGSSGIGIKTIKALVPLLLSPSCASLKGLGLGDNQLISDNEVEILCAALAHNSSITSLYLWLCNIGEYGGMCIEHLLNNYNTTISQIRIQNNNNMNNDLVQRLETIVKSKSRFNILKCIPPILTAHSDIHQYISAIYSYTWKLQILTLESDIPRYIFATFQILEYLKAKYIPMLLQRLKLESKDIPPYLISNDSEVVEYLLTIIDLLRQLQFPIHAIPSAIKESYQILPYLQSISQLLQFFKITLSDIPPNIKSSNLILEYLQVKDLMRSLEISEQQIPKIFNKSLLDQLQYLTELKRGKQSTKKITLMVVGEEGVGKTSLIQNILSSKWVGDTFDGYDFKLNHNQKQERIPRMGITDGIDIHLYQPEGKDFIMNIYDFAGQEIYYSTHAFVLSSQAIYLLLFDASKSINSNRIAHWIHTLSSVAPGASVFLVATHFDHPSSLKNLPTNLSQLQSILSNIP